MENSQSSSNIMISWHLNSKVELYFKKLPAHITDAIYPEVISEVTKLFSVGPIHPIHINDSIEKLSPQIKSPGLPHLNKGCSSIDQIDKSHIKQYLRNLKYGVHSKCIRPCILARPDSRAHADKLSLIFPAAMVFAEGMFTIPLVQEMGAKCGTWAGYGQGRISHHCEKHQSWLSLAWKKCEYNVPAWLIRKAFDVIRGNLDFGQYQGYGTPATAELLPTLWKKIVNYFINTPIQLVGGKVRVKQHGIPFDSRFANLIETICNVIVCKYVLRKLEVKQVPNTEWYSDDQGLILLNSTLDLTMFAECARADFGFELDLSKSRVEM